VLRRPTIALAAAGTLIFLPASALAARVLVDHGHGPTVVHNATYADIETQVHSWTRDGSTQVRLMVDGLPPGQTFGAHVHKMACGSDPLASGGHYQHSTDASIPLVDREIWLDVTADADGHAMAQRTVPWVIEAGTAGSVVIHASPTNPTTGAAGARLACTDVAFGQ
jgi:Cu-Zn family superoxide dismutase